jgi:hypothetical protein
MKLKKFHQYITERVDETNDDFYKVTVLLDTIFSSRAAFDEFNKAVEEKYADIPIQACFDERFISLLDQSGIDGFYTKKFIRDNNNQWSFELDYIGDRNNEDDGGSQQIMLSTFSKNGIKVVHEFVNRIFNENGIIDYI